MIKVGTPGWKNKTTRMILTIWLEQIKLNRSTSNQKSVNDQSEIIKVGTPGWRLRSRVSRSLATKKNQSFVGGRRSDGFDVWNVVVDVETDWVSDTLWLDTYAKSTRAWIHSLFIMSTPFAKVIFTPYFVAFLTYFRIRRTLAYWPC